MSSEANVVVGPYRIASTGPLTLQSEGAGVQIRSSMGDDGLQLDAETNVRISSLPAMLNLSKDGEVLFSRRARPASSCRPSARPWSASVIQMEPTSIKMSVGPPVGGRQHHAGARLDHAADRHHVAEADGMGITHAGCSRPASRSRRSAWSPTRR